MNTYDTLVRVSKMNGRKASADSTMTLTDQRSLINGELNRIGGKQGKPFEALDQSGFTVLDSPVIDEIVERIRSGASNGLVIAYGDRLARNSWDLGGFFKRMEKAGAEIHDASMPGIDYRTPEGRQLTMMRGVANEEKYFSSKRRGDNVADQVVARGVANAVPYGYRRNAGPDGVKSDPTKDAKALVPHDEHTKIVKQIFALRLQGQRIAAIVRILNDAGVPSPKGRRWSRSTVETIVKNEVYTGVVKLGERRSNEGAHKALVSKAEWRRAQSTRAVTLSGTYKSGLAGGLVVCSGCGGPLKVAGRADKLTYSCRTSSANGACPRPVHITKTVTDEVVTKAIVRALDKRALVIQSSGQEVKDARKAITQAEEAKAKVLAKVDLLTDAELEEALVPKREAIEQAQRRYDEALAQAEASDGLPEDGSAFLKADEIVQRRTAKVLIDRVVVAPPLPDGTPEDRLDVVFTRSG
jgi:DNA invertase Pin-like site-specific DNA recombinase